MKKALGGILAAGLLLVAALAFADKGVPVFKKGDKVYACACGEGCACKTISRKEGACACGNKLGLGTVSSVEGDKVVVKLKNEEVAFPTTGGYVCACGDACTCGTISQKPGTCGCGKKLKKVQ